MMKLVSLVSLFCFLGLQAQAAIVASMSTRSFSYSIEPIFGLQQVYRDTPTTHTTSRLFYGGRFVIGTDRISGELEYTKGDDTETYTSAPQKITYKDDLFKLGLRHTRGLGNLFFLTGRLGGQYDKRIKETTTNGTVAVENTATTSPYAGLQIGIRIGKNFSIALGSTVVFSDLSSPEKNDYQNTISIGIGN